MFNSNRQFAAQTTNQIVASESQKLSVEQRQRDVYESHRHRVFAVGYYMTSNEIEAEGILTDTFVHAFNKQPEPDAHGVDCALVGELEKRFSLAPEPSAQIDPFAAMSRTSVRRTDMEEALRLLPPSERLVFLLRDVEGYPAAKIAPLVSLSESEVQRMLMSARIRMRNAIAAARAQEKAREAEEAALQPANDAA